MDSSLYLKFIEAAARDHSRRYDLIELGSKLTASWSFLEDRAKAFEYDVFVIDEKLHECIGTMTDLLYRVPDATVEKDCKQIHEKNREYGGSWKRRGGIGAFFMLARKWDRVEVQLQKKSLLQAISEDTRPEGILDDLGDLRRYLILVIAEHYAISSHNAIQPELAF